MFTLDPASEEFQSFWADIKREDLPILRGQIVNGEWISTRGGIHGCQSFALAGLRSLSAHYKAGTFLDLGSGGGEGVIFAAKHGLRAYGIDFCPNANELAERNIRSAESANYITRDLARIALGNFFPQDFKVERATEGEDEFREEIDAHQRECCTSNPYQALGITLKKIDLFYHYQVERRSNILRLVADRAQVGARLLFCASMGDTFEVPVNVRETKINGFLTLYEKVKA